MQDDLSDWEEAATHMAGVYENALLTFAATWSSDSNNGCFSKIRSHLAAKALDPPGLFVRPVMPQFPHWGQSSDAAWPLLDRAWVFQERKLSTRILHLAQDQLYWECNSAFLSETTSETSLPAISSVGLKRMSSDHLDSWRSIVEHYSRLKLTFVRDRLPAISALVERLQTDRPYDTYIEGMWADSLLEDLAWRLNQEPDADVSRPDEARPTWSWTSVPGGVTWRLTSPLPSVCLVDAKYTLTGPAHFGLTINASITLRAPATAVQMSLESGFTLMNLETGPSPMIVGDKCQRDFGYTTATPPILPGEMLTLMLLVTTDGKVTRMAQRRSGIVLRTIEHGLFQRVGSMDLVHDPQLELSDFAWEVGMLIDVFVDALPVKEFTII